MEADIGENFLGRGGRAHGVLERVRRDVPIALHGVSLSIRGVEPLSESYLQRSSPRSPPRIGAHEGFRSPVLPGTFRGHYARAICGHCLIPRRRSQHVVSGCERVQAAARSQGLLLENVASYVEYHASTLPEWEFLAEVAARRTRGILLDREQCLRERAEPRFLREDVPSMPSAGRRATSASGGPPDGGGLLTRRSRLAGSRPTLLASVRARARALRRVTDDRRGRDERVPALGRLEAEAARARAVAASWLAAELASGTPEAEP